MNTEDNAKPSEGNVVSIGYTKSGSYDDDDYYELVFDEAGTAAVIRHRWHHWRPRDVDQGTEDLTLEQLKTESSEAYEKAILVLAEKGFPSGSLTKESETDT